MTTGTLKETGTDRAPSELLTLLMQIASSLEELYDCLRSQQKAVVEWDLNSLLRNVSEQNRLARDSRSREKHRQELLLEIAGDSSVTLSALAESLGGPWPDRYSRVGRRIREAAVKVETMKKQNEFLLGKARELVTEQLKLFMELARINRNVYESSGKKSRKANLHKVFDQKI